MIVFQTGEPVTITCEGRTIPGFVHLASPNGKSLMLMFDAMLDGHVGMMPVMFEDDGVFRALMTGVVVELARR
jgi:hypothetical protein